MFPKPSTRGDLTMSTN